MLKVVSDTTPIISLLKILRLDILRELYSEVSIPTAVFQEIEAGKNKTYYQDLSRLSWIHIVEIHDKSALKYFLDLDAGESEAILLASQMEAGLLIMDEKLGRFHAKHVGLRVTGTIGVLIKAKKQGLIKTLKPLLNELKKKGVWINENLVSEVLKEVGEQ
jgi:predicted nucleic acid-binding protein